MYFAFKEHTFSPQFKDILTYLLTEEFENQILILGDSNQRVDTLSIQSCLMYIACKFVFLYV